MPKDKPNGRKWILNLNPSTELFYALLSNIQANSRVVFPKGDIKFNSTANKE